MYQSKQVTVTKKVSAQKKNKQIKVLDLKYTDSGVFTSKFVGKYGWPMLNTDHFSLHPKFTYNFMARSLLMLRLPPWLTSMMLTKKIVAPTLVFLN